MHRFGDLGRSEWSAGGLQQKNRDHSQSGPTVSRLGFDEVHNPFVQRLHWSEVVQQFVWTAGRYLVFLVSVQLTELSNLCLAARRGELESGSARTTSNKRIQFKSSNLFLGHLNRRLQHNPVDALEQRGCGQGAFVGEVA